MLLLKNQFYKILLFSFTLFSCCSTFAQANQTVEHNQGYNIRVLLDEKNSKKENSFVVYSDDGFVLSTPNSKKKFLFKDKELKISIKNNNIYLLIDNEINKVKDNTINLIPQKNNLILNSTPYKGRLTLKIDTQNNTLLIINSLSLDDYLYSVLGTESYPTWPMEMQRVQAIVSRTYAVYCTHEARKNKTNQKPYDLKCTNFHQIYNGQHNYTFLRKAIEETHDLILAHKNDIVLAMFDACCGGIIPAKMRTLDFGKAPYLARQSRCIYCQNYELFNWHNDIYLNSFLKSLNANSKITRKIKAIGNIKDIVVEKDKAGIAHKIKLVGSKKTISLTGQELRESLREKIKSLNFDVKKIRDRVVINGHGYGHQLGLCQHGAKELVDQGWSYQNILKFYYPGTHLAKLTYA